MYNKTIFMGRLSADPELRVTQSGKSVCSFSVAVKRKMQDVTDFHDCVAWGKTGEAISKHFHKGKEILVEGELQKRSYEKDGQKRYITEVVVEKVHLLSGAPKQDNQEAQNYQAPSEPANDYEAFVSSVADDDLPF